MVSHLTSFLSFYLYQVWCCRWDMEFVCISSCVSALSYLICIKLLKDQVTYCYHRIKCTATGGWQSLENDNSISASSWDYGTYHIGDQQRLRQACASMQSRLSLRCYGSRRRVQPKIRHLAPLDDCACTFEEWVYGGWKEPFKVS